MLDGHAMRLLAAILLSGCMAGAQPDQGDDDMGSDGSNGSNSAACALPATNPDAGSLSATAAQRCNVSGSMGAQHWYRLAATLPAAR